MINNGQALKTVFRGLQFIQSDQCWGSWSSFEGILICWMLPHASRSIGGQTISGINRRSQIIHFSLRDPERMCSLRCIQSATISLDCPYLGLLGSYITNSYMPMGFQMFVGGFGAQKWFKNGGLSKNTIFKPKSLHKTLGFGRCL